jgi:hypothetical protein
MPLFIFSTHIQCTLIQLGMHNRIAMITLKPYTLAGFEPGSAVPQVDAMSTVPLRASFLLFNK